MENKAYKLKLDGKLTQVYCNMNGHALGGCGGVGWTLVVAPILTRFNQAVSLLMKCLDKSGLILRTSMRRKLHFC